MTIEGARTLPSFAKHRDFTFTSCSEMFSFVPVQTERKMMIMFLNLGFFNDAFNF